jgi:hypothetical protein
LLRCAERAGFTAIQLELEAVVKPFDVDFKWETFIRASGNPKIPTLQAAMEQALTPGETEEFVAHVRPQLEQKQGIDRSAVVYINATK